MKGKGKVVNDFTRFDKELRKLEWIGKDKGAMGQNTMQ